MKYKIVKLYAGNCEWAIWEILSETKHTYNGMFLCNSLDDKNILNIPQTLKKNPSFGKWHDISAEEIKKYKLELL